jgi:DNA modification methylase
VLFRSEISKEFLRILKKDGAYFLNIGDTYIDKGLQMIPQRVAYRMINEVKMICHKKKVGWLLRNQIIWYKSNHMPSPIKTRYTNTYEPIYFFTRDDWEKQVYFNLDAIRIPYKLKEENCNAIQLSLGVDDSGLYKSEKNNNFGFQEELSEEDYKKLLPQIEKKNKELNYNGKFKGHETNIGASPGGRSSITGIKYVKKRKVELPRYVICDYLRQWIERKGISVEEIDKKLGYAYTAGHWFRKDAGGSLPTPHDWIKLKKLLEFDDKYDKEMTEIHYVLQTIRKHPNGKNPGDVWEMKCAKLGKAHFSVFPEELPRNAILACCPPNGIVLDPFAGSGTTCKVAKELNRKSILIELQPQFLEIIKERCGNIKEIKI